jgi:hypothetical protein
MVLGLWGLVPDFFQQRNALIKLVQSFPGVLVVELMNLISRAAKISSIEIAKDPVFAGH